MRKPLWAIFILCCVFALAAPASGVHLSPRAEQGEAIFQKNCSACHTVGGGPSAGPDLAGVTSRRDHAWLVRIITSPEALLDSGDPVAKKLLEEFRGLRMPDFGISKEEAEAVLAYLAAGSASSGAPAPGPQAAVEEKSAADGDPEIGRFLFSGSTRFRNGGAACLACHTVAGLPGEGRTLGPDLTRTYSDYGDKAITAVLAEFPFPSMKPIFDTHRLTPEEQVHLKAFLRVSAEREPAGEKGGFLLFGIGGGLLLIGVAHVLWRNRLTEVRRPLTRRKAGTGGGGA